MSNLISTPALLAAYERCARRGYKLFHQEHQGRILVSEAVERAVRAAWMSDSADPGIVAHDTFMALAREPGLAQADTPSIYATAINHAAIAELISTLVRKPQDGQCLELPAQDGWTPHAFLDASGSRLLRFLAVSRWSHERSIYETRSWFGLGETAFFNMPMQLVVAVLGPLIKGRRYSPWARGWWHNNFKKLRFQKKHSPYQQFQGKWMPVWREEQEHVSRDEWLQAMLDDQILTDCLFVIDIPVPEDQQRGEIVALARRKLKQVAYQHILPDIQFTACYDLIHPCPFLSDCHGTLPEAAKITSDGIGDDSLDAMSGVMDRVGVAGQAPRFGRPL